MDAIRRRLRRQQLDGQLAPVRGVLPLHAPMGGWIKSIRMALGMSLKDLAARVGTSAQSSIHQFERGEVDGTITVKKLRLVADALNCDVSIVFVPRISLEQMVQDQTKKKVTGRVNRASHTMVMENQRVGYRVVEDLILDATQESLENGDSRLWE